MWCVMECMCVCVSGRAFVCVCLGCVLVDCACLVVCMCVFVGTVGYGVYGCCICWACIVVMLMCAPKCGTAVACGVVCVSVDVFS